MEASIFNQHSVPRNSITAIARFTSRFYDVPHEFNVRMQDEAFAWLDTHLRPRA